MYLGNFVLGVTLDHYFTTRRFSTGAPFTLAGTPAISAYEDNGTTEITAGITLTADFDSRTGLNHVRIVATGGNGFEAGKSYYLVITAGTVDSVSVVGEVIGSFTIERGDKTGYAIGTGGIAASAFAAGAIDAAALAADAANEIRDSVFARAFSAAYGSHTFDELVKMIASVLLGKCSGMGGATGTFRNLADNGDVVVATQDADGNRTAVTRTP